LAGWREHREGLGKKIMAKTRTAASASARRQSVYDFPDVHFGPLDREKGRPNWRTVLANEPDRDDEDGLSAAPQNVVSILGFDPRHPDDDDNTDGDNDGDGGAALVDGGTGDTVNHNAQSWANVQRLAKIIGGTITKNNHPFDIVVGDLGIEVKTITDSTAGGRINIDPAAQQQKESAASSMGLRAAIVVIDNRDPRDERIFVSNGDGGTLSLKSMQEVDSLQAAAKLLGAPQEESAD
jgi:hypothetical protein